MLEPMISSFPSWTLDVDSGTESSQNCFWSLYEEPQDNTGQDQPEPRHTSQISRSSELSRRGSNFPAGGIFGATSTMGLSKSCKSSSDLDQLAKELNIAMDDIMGDGVAAHGASMDLKQNETTDNDYVYLDVNVLTTKTKTKTGKTKTKKQSRPAAGKANKIPRPKNKWIIYLQATRTRCRKACRDAARVSDAAVRDALRSNLSSLDEADFQEKLAAGSRRPWDQMFSAVPLKLPTQQQLAKLIGVSWHREPPTVIEEYTIKQEVAAREHRQRYPDYIFRPIQNSKMKSQRNGNVQTESADHERPGRNAGANQNCS